MAEIVHNPVELGYFPDTSEAWPIDVKVIVMLATLLGCFGVLNVASEILLWTKPANFRTVGGWAPGGSRQTEMIGITIEGFRLLCSALLLTGGVAFFARKRAARKILLAGAALMLISVLIAVLLYWYYQGISMVAANTVRASAGDWAVRLVWQGERIVQNCAVPLLLMLVMARPGVKTKFSA